MLSIIRIAATTRFLSALDSRSNIAPTSLRDELLIFAKSPLPARVSDTDSCRPSRSDGLLSTRPFLSNDLRMRLR